jgi:F0F1-type ATP synthase assembly protein I
LQEHDVMLDAIAIVLLALWLLGVVASYTMGGLIHVLPVIALVVLIARLIRSRAASRPA